jgi:hypothetical protein
MSIAPALPPEIVALPADLEPGAVVIPFRHRAPEPAAEPDVAPDPDAIDPDPAPAPTGARRAPARVPMPRGAVRPGTRVVRPAGPPRSAPLRLTRRGRVVLAIAGLLGALAFGMLSARLIQNQTAIPASAPATVQVQPGDTVWTIAKRVAPQADTRSVVDTIIARNNLVGGVVHPGQHLVIHP